MPTTGATPCTDQVANGWSNAVRGETDNNQFADRGEGVVGTGRMDMDTFAWGTTPFNGSRILGVTVKIQAKYTSGNWVGGGIRLSLTNDGGTSISSTKDQVITTVETEYTLGGTMDTWGMYFTSAQLTSSNFRVRAGIFTCHPKGEVLTLTSGDSILVEDVVVGTELKGLEGAAVVQAVTSGTGQKFYRFNNAFTVTPEHPLMINGRRQKQAQFVQLGEHLMDINQELVEITLIEHIEYPEAVEVFCFTVTGGVYFAGSPAYLVHNKDAKVGTPRWGIDYMTVNVNFTPRILSCAGAGD